MKISMEIPDDLARYLAFLEKVRYVRSTEDSIKTALTYFKELGMHDWIGHVYRVGGSRVFLFDRGTIMEMFHALTNERLYDLGFRSAYRRKIENQNLAEIDTSNRDNWGIVIRDLELLGWGVFKLTGQEIRIELCPFPTAFLIGYFTGMLKRDFVEHPAKILGVVILIPRPEESCEEDQPKKSRFKPGA